MCNAPEFHMYVVLLNHGNTGTQVPCEPVHSHSVVCERHGGVVVPQAVHGTWLAVSCDPSRLTNIAKGELNPGDLLIVDRHATPTDNHLVIILANDGLMISRFSNRVSCITATLPEQLKNVTNLPIWGVVTYSICKQ
jgi:hypothetical protein